MNLVEHCVIGSLFPNKLPLHIVHPCACAHNHATTKEYLSKEDWNQNVRVLCHLFLLAVILVLCFGQLSPPQKCFLLNWVYLIYRAFHSALLIVSATEIFLVHWILILRGGSLYKSEQDEHAKYLTIFERHFILFFITLSQN